MMAHKFYSERLAENKTPEQMLEEVFHLLGDEDELSKDDIFGLMKDYAKQQFA